MREAEQTVRVAEEKERQKRHVAAVAEEIEDERLKKEATAREADIDDAISTRRATFIASIVGLLAPSCSSGTHGGRASLASASTSSYRSPSVPARPC